MKLETTSPSVNTLLLYPEEVSPSGLVQLFGARARHASDAFHDVSVGISIPASVRGGPRGRATYLRIEPDSVELTFEVTKGPMPRNPITLVVAVSRPQTIKKVIQAAVFLGVERLVFARTDLTEKSYLSSRELRDERITLEVERALEQCGDSIGPVISIHRALSEVVEEQVSNRWAFFAHTTSPGGMATSSSGEGGEQGPPESVTLAIGPEKGWSVREQHLFIERGFQAISLGERVLRVDAAVYIAIAALMPPLIVHGKSRLIPEGFR